MESNVDSSLSASTNTPISSASSFVNLFLNEINNQDIRGLLDVQRSLLEQLDRTNEKLDGINKLSAKRYLDATRDFSCHTQMLTTMKNDLDLIFKRIKLLKVRLNKKYPEAYTSAVQARNSKSLDEKDDKDFNDRTTPMKPITSSSLAKSKTVDCSQLTSSIHETYSSTQLGNDDNKIESATNSMITVPRFILDRSSSGQNFSTIFKNARNELRKINDELLGGQNKNNQQ